MIVSCTACETRYLVDDAELGGENGRLLRCSSCGNLWHYSAEAAAIHQAVAAVTAQLEAQAGGRAGAAAVGSTLPPAPALRAEPGTQAQPLPSTTATPVRPVVALELPGAGLSRSSRSAWAGGLALAAAGVAIVILARDNLRASYPPFAALYHRIGLGVAGEPPLQLTTTLNRTPEALTVLGTIANASPQPQPVAGLRVTLRDGDNRDLAARDIAPPVALLLPGVTAQYSTTFEHPSITAVAADVVFARRVKEPAADQGGGTGGSPNGDQP